MIGNPIKILSLSFENRKTVFETFPKIFNGCHHIVFSQKYLLAATRCWWSLPYSRRTGDNGGRVVREIFFARLLRSVADPEKNFGGGAPIQKIFSEWARSNFCTFLYCEKKFRGGRAPPAPPLWIRHWLRY